MPAADTWDARLTHWQDVDPAAAEDRVLKAIALYVLTEALGRAMELVEAAERVGALRRVKPDDVRRWITWVFQYADLEGSLRALDVLRLARAVVRLAVP